MTNNQHGTDHEITALDIAPFPAQPVDQPPAGERYSTPTRPDPEKPAALPAPPGGLPASANGDNEQITAPAIPASPRQPDDAQTASRHFLPPAHHEPGQPPTGIPGEPDPAAATTSTRTGLREHPDPTAARSDSLTSDNLLRSRHRVPADGWRRLLYTVSGGRVRPGPSPAELRRRDLTVRACTPVAGGHHRIAVMSMKGGVGKTTVTAALGATLADLRGDRIIAVDANPDRGTLADKVRLETAATIRDLLTERGQIHRYADVRAYTSQTTSRLEILASDQDPAVSEAFSAADYQVVADILEHFYSICLTDCGTGLLHSAMTGVLGLADQLVLVSSPSVDGARSASATVDWLLAHGYQHLVHNSVVVLTMLRRPSKSPVDLVVLEDHFGRRCRAVIQIPYDDVLAEGAEIHLDQLTTRTRDGFLTLAAAIGDGFSDQ